MNEMSANGTQAVFTLRREGRLQEALQLARKLYAQAPNDPWNIKAFFWSLYGLWRDGNCPDQERQNLAREMLALKLPADDHIAQNALQSVRRSQDLSTSFIARARQLSQSGNHKQAIAVLEECLEVSPGHAAAENALAWAIVRQLNHLLKQDNPPIQEIDKLVHRYAQCQGVERPSLIHSQMLGVVARAARAEVFPRFCAFFHWWRPEANIRSEDQIGQRNNQQHEFPSIVEQVIFAIGKTIEYEEKEDHLRTALHFLNQYVPRYPDQEWFPYFLALALHKVGQPDEALKYLVPFARRKSKDFWVWQKLALCFPPDDPKHLACLCRSVLCSTQRPEFLLTVRQQLAVALHVAGYDHEARYEIETVVRVRQQHGWRIPESIQSLQGEVWYKEAVAQKNIELFRTLALQADEILLDDIPWSRALLQATGIQGKRGAAAILLVELGSGQQVIWLPMNAFSNLKDLRAGTPLSVRVLSDRKHQRILALQQRDGQLWDLLPEIPAIVTRIHKQKEVTVLLLKNGETSLASHGDLPESMNLNVGDFVYVRSVSSRNIKHAKTMQKCNQPVESEHWKSFQGEFRPRQKGGGYVKDVFIPAHLLVEGIVETNLSGLAVKQHKNHSDSRWIAIKVDRCEENTCLPGSD
ncbi:MAG: hypothetical protein Q6L49_03750 [Thermostichales cyanobacterium HHBFW_bins_127]